MQRFARQATVVLAVAVAAVFAAATVANAGPATDGAASAFGATITGGGEEIIPPTPEASVAMGEDASETLIDIPAEPLALSGTLTATAAAHEQSDIESALTVNSQEVAGPYNASGVGVVENLEVLVNQVGPETSLLTAAVVRAEAVGVCNDGVASYSANSEIVDLKIAGEDVPLNAPLEQIIDGVNDALEQTTLNQVVNIERNVVTQNPDGGIAVDALVVTLLAAAGDDPLAQVRIAHGEVGPLACGPGLPRDLPECSDGIDNDGDDLIDFPDDPGCDSPEDDDERDEAVIDANVPAALPRTGTDGGALAAGAIALGSAAAGLTWLRRRLTV